MYWPHNSPSSHDRAGEKFVTCRRVVSCCRFRACDFNMLSRIVSLHEAVKTEIAGIIMLTVIGVIVIITGFKLRSTLLVKKLKVSLPTFLFFHFQFILPEFRS